MDALKQIMQDILIRHNNLVAMVRLSNSTEQLIADLNRYQKKAAPIIDDELKQIKEITHANR